VDSLLNDYLDELKYRDGGPVPSLYLAPEQLATDLDVNYHTHKTEAGVLVRCYHKCRTSMASPRFWIGLTVGFFPEHYLWEKVPPFSLLTKLVGL
jgi:hypothetical protein